MGPQPGPDGVRDAFCKIAPAEMARLFDPLLCKTAITKSEPLSFKDGRVVWFWKGKRPQNLDSNQRNILKANTIGKLYDRFVRSNAIALFFNRRSYSPSAEVSPADPTTWLHILSSCSTKLLPSPKLALPVSSSISRMPSILPFALSLALYPGNRKQC